MDFNRLKELVKKLGGVLVLDGNEPQFVMLPYENYEKMETGEVIPISNSNHDNAEPEAVAAMIEEQKTVDELNQEIAALKEEIRQKESAELLESGAETEAFDETVDLN